MKQHPGKAYHVTGADHGQTLAAFLRGRLGGASWSRVQKLVRGRQVLVHGNLCTDVARRLKDGEVVKVLDVAAPPLPRADDARVVHLDDDVVVVEKPTGVTTTRHHEEASWPAKRRQLQPTLEELVPAAIAKALARRRSPPVRAVHRIDRETSGLVVFARNVPASRILAEQFRVHTTHRRYLALVAGRVNAGTIRMRLIRDRGDGRRGSSDTEEGKEAITHVAPVEHFGNDYTLVECRLETGRTHQIRIHMTETGHPVCGDRVYTAAHRTGPRRKGGRDEAAALGQLLEECRAPRVMLHAAELGFVHPVSGETLRFTSPLPADMRKVLAALRKRYAD